MPDELGVILLLALPGSGKSEISKYLATLPQEVLHEEFHLGDIIKLDDYPYVELMRKIDEALIAEGKEPIFFQAPDKPFKDPRDWGTLIHLLNDDARLLLNHYACPIHHNPHERFLHITGRIDHAALQAGIPVRFNDLGLSYPGVAKAVNEYTRRIQEKAAKRCVETLEGKTVFIEFSRGGQIGAQMPLPAPYGYQYSLSQLSPSIRQRAVILYIHVTAEEARRKNERRGSPESGDTIIHHVVPLAVMENDYGCDDIEWLEGTDIGIITIQTHDQEFFIPIARFENCDDMTTFLRDDQKTWDPKKTRIVYQRLKEAFQNLAEEKEIDV